MLALVMSGAMVAQAFGRFTYGVVLPAVRDDMLGSNRMAGLLGTVNVGAYLAGTLVVATVSTSVPLATLVRIGLALSTGGLLLASFAGSGAVLAIALIAMGLGGAAIWIPSPRLAAAALPPARRGLAAGLVGLGIGVGIVFAGRLSDALRHRGGDPSWRDVYRVEAIVGFVVLAAALAVLRDPAPTDGTDIADARTEPAPPSRPRRRLGGFDVLRRVNGWVPLTAAYAAYGFMYLLVFAFLVTRLEDDSGFSPDEASAMFAAVGFAAVFGGILLGPLSDRIGRRATMAAAFVTFGVSDGAILVGHQPWVLLGCVGVGLSFSGLPSIIAAYVVDETDPATYGPAYSAATLAFGVAQAAAPQVGGAIADWRGSFTPVFVLSGVFAVVGAGCALGLPRRGSRPRPSGEPPYDPQRGADRARSR